jgi:hypothetical protein
LKEGSLDDHIDYVEAFKSMIDEVFASRPFIEAVRQTVRQILPVAKDVLNPIQYQKVKQYADEIIRG